MSAAETEGEERPSSSWQLLRQPRFARFLTGTAVSNIGTWFQDIAAAILIFEITGQAVLVGALALFAHGLSLVLAPLGGQLADRFDRRRLLIVIHLAQGLIAATLAVLAWLGFASVPVVFVIAFLLGVGRALGNPTLQAMLPAVVEKRDFAQGAALLSVTFNLARVVGPVLGALLYASLGPGPAFAVNASSFFVFALILMSLRVEPRLRSASGRFADALRYVWQRRHLLQMLVLGTLIGMASDPVITLGPALAVEFGEDESRAGWFVAAFGLGAVLGAPFAGALRRAVGATRLGLVCVLVIPVAFGAVAVSPSLWLALAFFLIAGIAFLLGISDLLAGVQEGIDDEVRGRVMALWTMGFVGSRPLAALIDGSVADATTPQLAVAVLGAVILVVALVTVVAVRASRRA